MAFLDFFKGSKALLTGQKAYKAHGKGDYEEALRLYEEARAQGLTEPRYLLGYTVLLIRTGAYQKARELLVSMQKHPGLTPDQRTELFVNYAACAYKLGEIDKGISLLQRQHQHAPAGLIYQTLGCLLVEKYALENTPDFDAMEAAARAEAAALAEAAAGDETAPQAEDAPEAPLSAEAGQDEAQQAPVAPTAREKWAQGIRDAEAFELEAVDYDDEDAVCLDNMGQFLYRVKGDRAAAREWFERAVKIKPNQIDTLWFLSRYDLEEGHADRAVEKLTRASEGRFSPLNHMNKEQILEEIRRLRETQTGGVVHAE